MLRHAPRVGECASHEDTLLMGEKFTRVRVEDAFTYLTHSHILPMHIAILKSCINGRCITPWTAVAFNWPQGTKISKISQH